MSSEDANTWSQEWPTEPGWYWFYGVFSGMKDTEPRLEPTQVRHGADRHPFTLRQAHFFTRKKVLRAFGCRWTCLKFHGCRNVATSETQLLG